MKIHREKAEQFPILIVTIATGASNYSVQPYVHHKSKCFTVQILTDCTLDSRESGDYLTSVIGLSFMRCFYLLNKFPHIIFITVITQPADCYKPHMQKVNTLKLANTHWVS